MRLHTLKPNPKAKKRKKRVGRGESSGLGKTCGRGSNGQKSRSGGSIRAEFEGGQMPLMRRLPKKGFSNIKFKRKVDTINLSVIEKNYEEGEEVTPESLKEKGIVKKNTKIIKLLSNGDLTKNLKISVHSYSKSSKSILEGKGIKLTELT